LLGYVLPSSQEVEDLNKLTRSHSTPPPELDPIPLSDIIGPLQWGGLMNDNAFGMYVCASVCLFVYVCVFGWLASSW